MEPFLAFAFALFCGALAPLFPMQVGVAFVGIALGWWKKGGRAGLLLASLCFLLGGTRACLAIAAFERGRSAVEVEGNGIRACEGEGEIVSSPTLRGDSFAWDAEVALRSCDGAPVTWRGRIRLYSEMAQGSLRRGDRVRFFARLGPMHRFWNDDDPRGDEAHRGILRSGSVVLLDVTHQGRGAAAAIDRARSHVRERILASFSRESAPFARALMLGENDLDTEDDRAFRSSGLSHLLAVSGVHLVLAVLVAVRVLRAMLLRWTWFAMRVPSDRVASGLGVPIAWLYADFAGGSGSALRAAWMLSALLLARACGRRSSGVRAYSLSVFALSLIDPLAVFDVSVVLSVLATGGLLLISQPVEKKLAPWISVSVLRTSIAATASATIACTPILLRMSSRIPTGSLLANLVAGPLGELFALPLCFLHALASPVPPLERGAAMMATYALLMVKTFAHRFSTDEAGALVLGRPLPWQLVILAVGAFWIVSVRASRTWMPMLAAGALLLSEIDAQSAPHELRVTFLDVGQGDSALLQLPSGGSVLLDGGGFVGSPTDPGTRAILPLLASRRVGALRAMVLSHPHPDHFTGLASVAREIPVDELWDTGQGEREGTGGAYEALLATVRSLGSKVLRPHGLCGSRTIDGVEFTVLAPCPHASSDRGPNDNSFVLRVKYKSRTFLFTGDAEHEEEGELLRLPAESLQADVLKVGHHGSRTSSGGAFLDRVAPAIAIVSSGVRNRYGHPHPTTLATFEEKRIPLHRTDREGAITVSTDGQSLRVETARQGYRAKDAAEPTATPPKRDSWFARFLPAR